MRSGAAGGHVRTITVMGTFVTIQVVSGGSDRELPSDAHAGVERAFAWFRHVEHCCTRFDPQSELMRLTSQIGVAVPVSALLYEAVGFALAVAEDTHGAFDPTVGCCMEARGFNREHRTSRIVRTNLDEADDVSYRDVHLDPVQRTITLDRPLILDLGAVVKGLAIDMAARELREFENFAVDAGGDLYLGGWGPAGAPWTIGIRHPRIDHALIDSIRVSNVAVCTSGDYERRQPDRGHHIVDPRTGASADATASVTVVGPTAMAADALATAAFVLGPAEGSPLLEAQGVDGLFVLPTLERHATPGMYDRYALSHGTSAAAC